MVRPRIDSPGRRALVKFLKQLRLHGRSQTWLAKVLHVSKSCVSEWARGLGRPTVGNALALLRLAGIALDAWLTLEERTTLAEIDIQAHALAKEPPPAPKKATKKKPDADLAPASDKRQIPFSFPESAVS